MLSTPQNELAPRESGQRLCKRRRVDFFVQLVTKPCSKGPQGSRNKERISGGMNLPGGIGDRAGGDLGVGRVGDAAAALPGVC